MSNNKPRWEVDSFMRYVPWATFGMVFVVAVPIGIFRGGASVVLWLGFAALAGAIMLFWEALRLALDPTLPGDEAYLDEDEGLPAEIETRKRAALQALRDIQFERSIGRLSQEDYEGLEAKYRGEASAAMQAMDEGLSPWMARAEALLRDAEKTEATSETKADAKADVTAEAKTETKADVTSEAPAKADAPATVKCAKCEQTNDPDAVFCKRCGARMKEEVADA